jgi:hypothetical protein
MITCTREEPWGRIAYDYEADEFEAYVREGCTPRISRPLSAGCLITGKCNLGCFLLRQRGGFAERRDRRLRLGQDLPHNAFMGVDARGSFGR